MFSGATPQRTRVRAAEVTRADIETLKRDVALGKTAKDRMLGPRRRSIVRGGKGVVTRLLRHPRRGVRLGTGERMSIRTRCAA